MMIGWEASKHFVAAPLTASVGKEAKPTNPLRRAIKTKHFSRSILYLGLLLLIAAVPNIMAEPSSNANGIHQHYGYLGVDFQDLNQSERAKLHLDPDTGVSIAAVDHDAPAWKAGLRRNDVIVSLDDKKASHASDLIETLHQMDPGQAITIRVVRDGRPLEIHVVLADRDTVEREAWSKRYTVPDPNEQTKERNGFLGSVPAALGKTLGSSGGLMSYVPGVIPYTGIEVDVLNPQLAEYFGLKNMTGLLVKRIDTNSPGMRAGIRAGDVIWKANNLPMISRSKWDHELRENRNTTIKLQILRDRQPRRIILSLAADN